MNGWVWIYFQIQLLKCCFTYQKSMRKNRKIFLSVSHSKHSWGDRVSNLNQWALLILLLHPFIERCYDHLQIILVVNLGSLSKVLKCWKNTINHTSGSGIYFITMHSLWKWRSRIHGSLDPLFYVSSQNGSNTGN